MTGHVDGPRGCRPEELPQVIALVDAAMREGSRQTMLTDYPLVYAPENLANVQVVVVDGRVVATAPVLPRRVRIAGGEVGLGVISPTATDPGFQHRGYGSSCVAACVGRMAALGIELSVLWTRIATFPFYERLGWQAVARTGATVSLGRDDAPRFPRWVGPIVRLADHPGRIPAVASLHAQARPGVQRSLSDLQMLTMLPGATTWLALDGAGVAGYLVASTSTNKPGILEAAGDPPAVEGLLHHALAAVPVGAMIDAQIGEPFPELAAAMARWVPDREPVPSTADMMIRLNDPARVVHAMRGWLEARWGRDRRSVSLAVTDAGVTVSLDWSRSGLAIGSRRRGDHVALTRRELTSIVFGAHPERPVPVAAPLAGLSVLRLPIPPLDRS